MAKKVAKKTAKKSTTKAKSSAKVAKKAVKKTAAKKKVAVKKSATKKKSTVKKSTAKKKTAKKKSVKAGKKSATTKKKVSKENSLADELLQQITKDRVGEKESLEDAVFQVEAHKFETQLKPQKSTVEIAAPRELETDYDETLLVPLVRDPLWVYLYWELSTAACASFQLVHGPRKGHQLILRWYDVTDLGYFDGNNAHHTFDSQIGTTTGSWYQKMPSDGRDWCVEIGVCKTNGSAFIPILRSRFFKTPILGIARNRPQTVRWMRVDPQQRTMVVFELPLGLVLGDFDEARGWDGFRITEANILQTFESGNVPFMLTEQQALRLVPPALLKSFGSDLHILPGFPGGSVDTSETLSSGSVQVAQK